MPFGVKVFFFLVGTYHECTPPLLALFMIRAPKCICHGSTMILSVFVLRGGFGLDRNQCLRGPARIDLQPFGRHSMPGGTGAHHCCLCEETQLQHGLTLFTQMPTVHSLGGAIPQRPQRAH